VEVLAYDLGASSGRALLGRLTDRKMAVEELHRFPNDPVQVGDRLHWDILRLYHEMKMALLAAKTKGVRLRSLGIDSWAVDFGFIGKGGELLGNPYHYRDAHTDGAMERLFAVVPPSEVFERTGIQFLPFNTIFQLFALKSADSPLLRQAQRLLMIPDLLRYFLTGEMFHEFTNATTTQLYNPTESHWDPYLLEKLDLPRQLFDSVLQPGSPAGTLRKSVCDELGMGSLPVIAVAEHDTGSAVVAVPAAERRFAYLSCGTWSLMGTETDRPVINEESLKCNFTNEGGAYGTNRLLKNIMGLWILQETRRVWERAGLSYTFPELLQLAERSPGFGLFIDPDDALFLPPGDMPERIRTYALRTGQKPPQEAGEFVRCILESLALKYRYVLELTERLSGGAFSGLHMVGGGIHNKLLCQWTANAIGKPVWAGPAEGSGIGNLAVQWIALGELSDIREARRVIGESFPMETYNPLERSEWDDAYGRFRKITGIDSND
jgi:rhamnulokinase